ncbi:PstS family phosphate ABC transporter substrate-binding protein [Cyclobacteriaceae bacterium]|nr:PstS family phosphate ABC transporter substrate-binding protein [Cyclobacteriaceae bacterium]
MRKLLYGLGIAALLVSCGGSTEKKGNGISGDIEINGSSTVYPVTSAVAEFFMDENEDVNITVGQSGTGGGFKMFVRGETDINDASRPIKEKEINNCKENNVKSHEITVAYDGIAVAVNKDNDFIDYLTVEELNKIWSDSENKATKWSDIRAEWPAKDIKLYGPGEASGTYDYFCEVIVGKKGSPRNDYNASENDNVLVKGVADDKYAMGYFGYSYYVDNKDKLKVIPIDGGNGPIAPSLETVMNKTYSPLSRPLFIYVSDAAAKKAQVVAFINYYLDNVANEELVNSIKHIPLPSNEVADQKKAFNTFVESNK